jgi:hypothetical protein
MRESPPRLAALLPERCGGLTAEMRVVNKNKKASKMIEQRSILFEIEVYFYCIPSYAADYCRSNHNGNVSYSREGIGFKLLAYQYAGFDNHCALCSRS